MKKLIFLLSVFAGFTACENESIQELPQETSVTEGIIARQNQKVDVCHKGNIINVSVDALSDHQGHGDAVDMDGDGYFDIENDCSEVDCDDNAYSEDNSCYPYTCGADLDFLNLDFTYSAYGSDCFEVGCGGFPFSYVTFQWLDSEEYTNDFSVFAYDLRNYTCADYYDDYLIVVSFIKYDSSTYEILDNCQESWGNNYPGNEYNLGPGTVELYDEAVGFINNLAADLGIEDQCANGARTSGADSVKNLESMPDELKNILEERNAMLPPTR